MGYKDFKKGRKEIIKKNQESDYLGIEEGGIGADLEISTLFFDFYFKNKF